MVVEKDHITRLHHSNEFERLYVDLRQAESRIYSDEEVICLPDLQEDHLFKKEWEIRKGSCRRLVDYLKSKRMPLKILEIGCGNGWFSNRLSQIASSYVIGLDVNLLELQQAERVFKASANLAFVYGDINSASLEKQRFDVVVFAAAIQYFQSIPDILTKALDRLNEGGEIHLVDSQFYAKEEINGARSRSVEYFRKKGFERMQQFYFHHTLEELKNFRYTIMHNPNSLLNKVFGPKNPFYWICIK